jgi:hypothetical protein
MRPQRQDEHVRPTVSHLIRPLRARNLLESPLLPPVVRVLLKREVGLGERLPPIKRVRARALAFLSPGERQERAQGAHPGLEQPQRPPQVRYPQHLCFARTEALQQTKKPPCSDKTGKQDISTDNMTTDSEMYPLT